MRPTEENLVEGRYVTFYDKNRAQRVGRILKVMPRAGDYIVGVYDAAANKYGTPFHRERVERGKVIDALAMSRRGSPWCRGRLDDSLPEVEENEPIVEAPEVSADAAREDA